MTIPPIACARCTSSNHPSNRFCAACGLPLGGVQADVGAGLDALGPHEAPDPSEPDSFEAIRDLLARSGHDSTPFGHGWQLVVPLHLDRKQAIYVGPAGTDPEGRAVVSLVSICGPANGRDARALLKLNARMIEGHFAIKVLRGEEYYVVVRTLTAEMANLVDAAGLFRRIALAADGLEDRLSRGRDLY